MRATEEEDRQRREAMDNIRNVEYIHSTTDDSGLGIARAPFLRLVKHILIEKINNAQVKKLQLGAIEALKSASIDYLLVFFEKCSLAVYHAKRVTLMPRDVRLVKNFNILDKKP